MRSKILVIVYGVNELRYSVRNKEMGIVSRKSRDASS